MSYSVLFRRFPWDHLDELAPVVARAYGRNDYDARAKIRRGWGFLERDASEENARRIEAAMGDCSGGVIAIDNTELRVPADPKVVTAFESSAAAATFHLQYPQEPMRVIEWARVGVVAAGAFSEEIIRRESGGNERSTAKMMMGLGVFFVTGLPLGLFGGGKQKDAKPVKSSRVITFGRVVTTAGEQFAFSPDHLDFSGLGEKKQMNTAANFRALLAEFAQRTSARLNLGARLLLENRAITFANYTSLHDFETELLWTLNVGALSSGS